MLTVILCFFPKRQEDTPEEALLMVTDYHMGTVAGAALVNENGGVALMIQDGEIEILDAPKDTVFSASDRKAFLYRMAHVPAQKMLGRAEEWEPYGLEHPQARLTLFLTDGSRISLNLGDQTPMEDGWYLRREDEEYLYLVDEVTARMMKYSLNDFREADVLPVISPDSLEELTFFQLTRDGETLEIQGEKRDGEVRFFLTRPFEAALSWQTVAEKLLVPLSGIERLEFVGDHLSENAYGFGGKEEHQLTLELAGERRTLYFVPGEGDTFYCKNPSNGQVILVGGEGIREWLDQPAADLMASTLYPANAADMEQVTVVAEGLNETLELRGQGELLRGYWGGEKLSQEEALKLFQTLTMIPPAEPLNGTEPLQEEPFLTLYFQRKNGTEDVLKLIPISQRRCAVQVNGAASFTTYTATIEELIRAVKGWGLS